MSNLFSLSEQKSFLGAGRCPKCGHFHLTLRFVTNDGAQIKPPILVPSGFKNFGKEVFVECKECQYRVLIHTPRKENAAEVVNVPPSGTLKIQKRDLRVFLCHLSSDKSKVEKFYNYLLRDGVTPWLDKKNLIPGQSWQIEIPKAVRNSDVVVVFLSSNFITKEGYVQKEIKIALDTADEKPDGTIYIIPAKLENCEVPERLAKYQWVDLFEKDGYELLFKALQVRATSIGININQHSHENPK